MKKLLIIIATSFLTTIVHAGNQNFTVTGVGVNVTNKTIYIRVSPDVNTVCTSKQYVRISTENDASKEVYSAALTAITTGKTLNVSYMDAPSTCLLGTASISSVFLELN